MAEWTPLVSGVVVALLAGMFSGAWLNRRNLARLTSSQAGQSSADAARILTDTALKIATDANTRAHAANERATALETRVAALEHRDDAKDAHIAVLIRQILNGDPPPPHEPPIPY